MSEPRRERWFSAGRGSGGSNRRTRAAGAKGGKPVTTRRRSGPPDEERWWDPSDQALAEREVLDRRTVGKGWRPAVMVNNVERAEPFGDDDASAAIESARVARVLTGLDEGRAWHHRDAGSLIVIRSEVYADPSPGVAEGHRAAWNQHAEPALDATWRERWRERDQEPGWVEARWVRPVDGDPGSSSSPAGPDLGEACDWLRIEDHTVPAVEVAARRGAGGRPSVTVYEHVTVWAPRRQVTVVVRHDIGLDLDDVVARCAAEVTRRLDGSG